jgi:TonB family protein
MFLHGLLLLITVACSAFMKREVPVENLPVLNIFDLSNVKMTDGATRGGNPNAAPPAPQQAPPAPAPVAPARQPEPEPEPEPEPPKPEPVVQKPQPAPPKPQPEPEPVKVAKPEIQIPEKPKPTRTFDVPKQSSTSSKEKPTATKPTAPTRRTFDVASANRKPPTTSRTTSQPNADQGRQTALKELAKSIGSSTANIQSKISGGTSVDMPGPGGEAFVNYAQLVQALYQRAWTDPGDVADENAVAKADVVVDRNGSIISSRISQGSGNAALDKSVQQALNRVRSLPRFPEGSSDSQRRFIIKFNLKAKRSTG